LIYSSISSSDLSFNTAKALNTILFFSLLNSITFNSNSVSTGNPILKFLIFDGDNCLAGTKPSTPLGSSTITPFSIILATLAVITVPT